MHWLTWQEIAEFFRTWQGLGVGILAALGAIYYGPRKVLETWDWYWDRFRDNEVFFVVSRRKLMQRPGGIIAGVTRPEMMELPFFAKEIADYLGRKEASVQRSLKRLRRRGKIEPFENGWRLRTP